MCDLPATRTDTETELRLNMSTLFSNRSIARRLQLGVGLAAGLVLGLTVWFNYRTARTELEQQTNAKAMSEIRAAARQVDDFIARIGMLPRSTASRQQAVGREPDPGMVPFMAQLLAHVPTNEVYGLAMAFEHKNWRETNAMPWVDRKSWPNQVRLDYDYHDPKWEWYSGPKKSGSFYVTEPYFDEGGSEITMVTLAVPMFDAASNFFGVATADLALDRLRAMVRAARLRGAEESGRERHQRIRLPRQPCGKDHRASERRTHAPQRLSRRRCEDPAGRRSHRGKTRGIHGRHDGRRAPARLLGDLTADRLEGCP